MTWPARPSEPGLQRLGDGPRLITRLLTALLVAVAVMFAEITFIGRVVLAPLELLTLDWRFQRRGPIAPSGEVALVLADDATVTALGAWPPPRDALARAIELLHRADVRVIVLDFLLAEAPEGASSAADQALARAVATAGNVVLVYAFIPFPGPTSPPPDWLAATAYRVRTGAPPAVFRPSALILPAAALGGSAATLGHISLLLDPDGSLRAHLPAVAYSGEVFPSAAIEAARLQLGLGRDRVELDGARAVVLGGRRVSLDGEGRQLLDHLGPKGTLPTYSLADLLSDRLNPSLLRGKVVVLGASAAGGGDRFVTPFVSGLPGSEHLGTAIDNLLTGQILRRAPALADFLLTSLLAVLAALLAGRRSPWWSLGVLLLLLGGLATTLQLAFVMERIWLAALPPTAATLLAGLAVEGLRLGDERRRRRGLERQKANLARYFAPTVVERLALSDRPAGLDRTQDAVVMFIDIVGFTRVSETMAPADAMALLRRFHTLVERAVFAHGGMLNDFMGDGAMVCFGVPDPSPTAAVDAIRAALDLLDALTAAPEPRLRVGIGIHAGPVLMGDIGGATQFQFTFIGDTVNVASRLEGLTRQNETSLIVSEAVLAAAVLPPDLAARFAPLPELAIRGRAGTLSARRLV